MRYFLQLVFALTLLAVIIWATWQGYLLLKQQQSGIPENMRSVVIISVIAVLVFAYLLTSAIQHHGDQYRRAHQSNARLVLYERFLSAWELTAGSIPASPAVTLQLNIQEFEGQLVLLASARVLKAYNDLQHTIRVTGLASPAAILLFKKLVLAMREDVGNSTGFSIGREMNRLRNLQST
jgi:uncharacterized membrane protein